MDLRIDPEFLSNQARLTPQEFEVLERSILRDGKIINPIVVWAEERIVVDGMHRYEIAKKHSLSFETKELSFRDRQEALLWMLEFAQLQMSKTRSADREANAERIVTLAKTHRSRLDAAGVNNGGRVREIVAKATGVSPRKVQNDLAHAKAVAQLAPSVRADIQSKEVKVSRVDVKKLSTLSPNDQVEVVRSIKQGKAKTAKEALDQRRLAQLDDTPIAKVEAWNAAIDEFCRAVGKAQDALPKGMWFTSALLGVLEANKKVYVNTAKKQKIDTDCPQCGGEGCDLCHQLGRVPKSVGAANGGR